MSTLIQIKRSRARYSQDQCDADRGGARPVRPAWSDRKQRD